MRYKGGGGGENVGGDAERGCCVDGVLLSQANSPPILHECCVSIPNIVVLKESRKKARECLSV